MDKIKLLFDGTRIVEDIKLKNHNGLFFVSINLLKTFLNNENYSITLYLAERYYLKSRHIAKKLLHPKTKIITILDKSEFVKNIEKHKKNIQTSPNFSKRILPSLKILKNKLKLFQYKHFNFNAKILKNFHSFLSPVYNISDEIRNYPHIKRFLLIHDIIPLLKPDFYNKDQFASDYFLYEIVKKLDCDCYFFVSESSKRDFIKFTNSQVDEKKLLVTYIASAKNFFPQYDQKKAAMAFKKYGIDFNTENKYILSFCSLEPRKNLLFTIDCFVKFIQKNKIDNLYFFLGGGTWSTFDSEFKKKMANISREYRNKIIQLGFIDDNDVNTLYSNAFFFVFISKYEGFGMPPLEAMQAGTPVITSNNSSLPEVVGDSAIMVDCESEEQCIKAFEDLYYNEKLQKKYVKMGAERVKLFSWEKTVDKMSKAISSIVNLSQQDS